ncbi:HTH-type transcriptional regulator DmlR [wastewater metagenome]|uniref:HTH-type transcriptional regulator DmlR n=2 Tax=unclassified sequences TaxID=12908 RepID=A0A5B8RB91_9ZZZZ|nr:LysR substrate-binding domain-containing protein [Arhodomonas sp. KWT]QEA05343.1 HTH-type transcriptional regulator DmlR [uncultured organism]
MPDLNDLYFFAAVAETGSFTAAARALGMPKSTLSRRIARLEDTLGIRLLRRSTRQLTLTDTGRAYHERCRDLVSAAGAAQGVVREVHEEPSGRVRVTCPITIAQVLLAPVIPEFLERHPHVSLQIDATGRPVDVVGEGVDVALRVRHRLEDSSLVMREFALSAPVVVASPSLLDREGEPCRPDDLSQMPTVGMERTDGRCSFPFEDRDGRMSPVHVTPRVVTDDLRILRELAVKGVGFAALPRYICWPELMDGRLVQVLADRSMPAGRIHAVYPYRRGLDPAVRHFIDFLGERLPEVADTLGVRPD